MRIDGVNNSFNVESIYKLEPRKNDKKPGQENQEQQNKKDQQEKSNDPNKGNIFDTKD